MKSITIHARIDENGKVKSNISNLKAAFKHFSGKEVEVIVKRKYNKRSLPQNRFYWGVTIPFFQQLITETWGEIRSNEEVHEILKAVCNYAEIVNEETGDIIKVPQSTTELTTSGWMDYELKMKQFAMEFFNSNLPEPNNQLEIKL